MVKKICTILASLIMAFIIMSSGYGLWRKDVVIEGNIMVVPNPKDIEELEDFIEQKYVEIEELKKQKRLVEEKKQEEEEKKEVTSTNANNLLEETQPSIDNDEKKDLDREGYKELTGVDRDIEELEQETEIRTDDPKEVSIEEDTDNIPEEEIGEKDENDGSE